MYTKGAAILNGSGLTVSSVLDFVNFAGQFKSNITIRKLSSSMEGNAKSIVMIIALGIEKGDEVVISAEGEDEAEAVEALVKLLENGLAK